MGRKKLINDEQLLQIAREVFLQSGAFGSTKDIALKAGISEAALFKRYPTKASLFLAALVPPHVDVDAIINADTDSANPQEALTGIGLRLLVYFRKHIPIVTQLMTHPLISMQDITAHFKRNAAMELTAALAAYLAKEQTRGVLKADNPVATAGLLVSAIHSLALFEMMEFHGGQDLEHAVSLFVNALWSGLAPLDRKHE